MTWGTWDFCKPSAPGIELRTSWDVECGCRLSQEEEPPTPVGVVSRKTGMSSGMFSFVSG